MENRHQTLEHVARIAKRRRELVETIAALDLRAGPIVWEVGCGHGHFLAAYAAAHPSVTCLGVDIARDRIDRGLRKRNRAKLKTLHFVQCDAATFLELLPPQVSLNSIYILFPDPWPKRRHHKNRIMQAEFLANVARRAEQGARLYFRTDDSDYHAAAQAVLESHPDWTLVSERWPFEHQTVFQSRAERHHSLTARKRSIA